MLWKLFRRKITDCLSLFNQYYLDVRTLYAMHFDTVPCVTYIGEIDGGDALNFIQEYYGFNIRQVLQHCYFDHEREKIVFNSTILLMRKGRIIEVTPVYCQILYTPTDYEWVQTLAEDLAEFKTEHEQPKQQTIGFAKSQVGD